MPDLPDLAVHFLLLVVFLLCFFHACASVCSVSKQVVNAPSFMVRKDAERHIGLSNKSPYGAGRPGRLARKKKAAKGGGDDGDASD